MKWRPNWQTYMVEERHRGLRRYCARSTCVAVNGVVSARRLTFTRRGAERWINKLREAQLR